jgi:two-component system OmpR family response regulator
VFEDSNQRAEASAAGGETAPAGESSRVLVVNGDPSKQRGLAAYLKQHGILVIPALDNEEAAAKFAACEPNLVILDLQPQHDDGLELLRQIRARSEVPVIITSRHWRDEADRVVGLELGADDYLNGPFGLRELVARIRAVLRRRTLGRCIRHRDGRWDRCRFGGWEVDRQTRRLTDPNGKNVALTNAEYEVLFAFVDAPLRTLTRAYLLHAMRVHEDVFDRSIDVRILRLRRKLETDADAPRIIRTERGAGYTFVLPVERL